MFPLSCVQSTSLCQYMDWHLTRAQSGVATGRVSNHVAFPISHSRDVIELLPGSVRWEYPSGETPKQPGTLINRFMETKGDFPKSDFRAPEWVHSLKIIWQSQMVGVILEQLRGLLVQCGLYHAVRAVQNGIVSSHYHFLCNAQEIQFGLLHFFHPCQIDRVCLA